MNRDRVTRLGRQLSSDDRRWLYEAASVYNGSGPLKAFLLAMFTRSRDPHRSDRLRPTLEKLDERDIEWICGGYEEERRRDRRRRLRGAGLKPER